MPKFVPDWVYRLDGDTIKNDLSSGLLMGVLVIPQSLAYAMLAGLPPIMGLYASIVPTLAYAYVGASHLQAVGPVAISAIMTAGSLAAFADYDNYAMLATTLAVLVGLILWAARLLKLGWITQFISRGVSAGFISAAALLILVGQLKDLLALPMSGTTINALLTSLYHYLAQKPVLSVATATLGLVSLVILTINRYRPAWFWGWLPKRHQGMAGRLFVLAILAVSTFVVARYGLDVRTLAPLPKGLPAFTLEIPSLEVLALLLPKAMLIALVVFVSTAAVSDKLAKQDNLPYHSNRELIGLGAANIASGLTGGFAVGGGISRTSLNIAVGSKSALSSVICALTILAVLLLVSDWLTGLPYAVLSAIIISSVLSMLDWQTLKTAYHQDKAECLAFLTSFFGVCAFGLNIGLVIGILTSFACLIYRSHQVHIAVVGQVGDSEHFRNVKRHSVRCFEGVLLVRIDESLYFGNASLVQEALLDLSKTHKPNHLVLIMTAVNHIDLTAQDMLMRLNGYLHQDGICLHYAEIKGPVMDALNKSSLLKALHGQVFLSTKQAVEALGGSAELLYSKEA